MFVRAKIISGKRYGYLVENTWKKGKVRQKVKKYLGPIIKLEKIDDKTFEEWKDVDLDHYVDTTFAREIIRDTIRWTLAMHEPSDVKVDLKNGKITRGGKSVVLELDGGYCYGIALTRLLKYKPDPEERPGERLGEAFSQASVPIDKELFILLYRKLHNV